MLQKTKNTGYVLYVIAVALLVCWAIGFVGYNAGGLIHILIIMALLVFLFILVYKRDKTGIKEDNVNLPK